MFSLGSRVPGAAWSVGQQSVSTSSVQNKQMCGLELHGYTPGQGRYGAVLLHSYTPGQGQGVLSTSEIFLRPPPHLEGDAWLAAVGWRW